MADSFQMALRTAGAGMAAQSTRMRIASENLANMHSTSSVPGGDPYRRRVVTFEVGHDGATGAEILSAGQLSTDATPFLVERDPGHPAADSEGNVKFPNVDMTIELADAREANRSYMANLQIVRMVKDSISTTIDLLKP